MEISFAAAEQKQELYELWKSSFDENDYFTSLFFENLYDPINCLVLTENGTIVSALHMLPSEILTENNTAEKANYIYGAATVKKFQGRGFMTKLLEYSFEYGKRRGEKYSVLIPAKKSLFSFYERCGYIKFSKIREVLFKRGELNKFCSSKDLLQYNFTIDNIEKLRFNNIIGSSGSVIWNKKHIEYAVKLTKAENGFIVYSKDSYAFVSVEESAAVIKEIVCSNDSIGVLISKIMNNTNADYFVFRLKEDMPIFENMGRTEYNGMIRTMDGKDITNFRCPYMGLVLD